MKNVYFLLLFIFGTAQAQVVTIPDANFKDKLLEAATTNNIAKDENGVSIVIDTNTDNEIQVSEALTVFELNIINSGIGDLTGIDAFTNITHLLCDQNNMNVLDVSALVNLVELTCSDNNLTELDLSGNPNLEFVWALSNPLEFMNVKNGSAFDPELIGTGTWMEIWANLPDGCYVCADESEVEIIDEQLNVFGSGKHVSSYCTFYPGGDYNTITGTVLFDLDNDGDCDIETNLQPYVRIDLTDGTDAISSFTNADGEYIFYTPAGTFTLNPTIEHPEYFTITPSEAEVTFPVVDNSIEVVDFCISPNGVHPDLEVVIAPVDFAVPGFDAIYKIVYRNKGNQVMTQAEGVNLFYQDQFMDFVSASETPDSQSEGLLSWDFADLLPFEERSILVTMNINAPTDPDNPVNIDDILVFEALVEPEAGDETPEDNTYTYEETVVGAFDPNDIHCLEGSIEDPVNIGEQLHYRIRFENTGNFPAQNVVVTMEINPEQYDPETMLLLNASHEVDARLVGTTAEFFFQNIQLSSGGHGNILLAVETLNSLEEGDEVLSKADIYFDYNYPVTTNDAITLFEATMSTQDPVLDARISVYPNPVQDQLTVKAEETISSIEWYDVAGRLLRIHLVNDSEVTLDLSKQATGVYFMKIYTEEGANVKKIIKK